MTPTIVRVLRSPAGAGRRAARLAASAAMLALALAAGGCATTHGLAYAREPEVGLASYYGHAHDGRRTANGERFDMDAMTAAHRTLPFGTRVRVTNLRNGRHAVVRINDRGPHRKRRIIDLSYAAARELGMVGSGVVKVRVEVVGAGS